MKIFPAIDLRGGKVVRLLQGDYDKMTVYGDDPAAQARKFIDAGAEYLHVVDLDGAKDGELSNFESVEEVARQGGLFIEIGGGIRTEERIEKYLDAGVGRCILGTIAVQDFGFTKRMIDKYGERIAVGVDMRDGYVAASGWLRTSDIDGIEFIKKLADAGCDAVIVTDISKDGALSGTNMELYRRLAGEVPGIKVTASGGISSEDEIRKLKEIGTDAAILGKSLYTGALDLGRCIGLAK